MKKTSNIVWGIILVAVGVLLGLNSCGITNIDIFFDGWWTLLLIIPSIHGLIFGNEKVMSVVGIVFGVLFLMAARDVFEFNIIWKLIIPALIVIIGIKLIFGTKSKSDRQPPKTADKEEMAAFCSKEIDYTNEEITLSKIGAFFGGAKCNLKNAVIKDGSQIDVCCIFGGADIIVPENVNVKINTFCLFGGVSDKREVKTDSNAVTLNVNGFCMFGGADIK